jgi:hypothetical protein
MKVETESTAPHLRQYWLVGGFSVPHLRQGMGCSWLIDVEDIATFDEAQQGVCV